MAVGPGKYDALCTVVRQRSKAKIAVIIIVDGDKGSGFSVQTEGPQPVGILPGLLRTMADSIEADINV